MMRLKNPEIQRHEAASAASFHPDTSRPARLG